MFLKEIKAIYHKELNPLYSKEEVASFFYMIIEDVLGLERFILAIRPNYIISKEEESPLFNALSELKEQKPIQYILGKSHFMDLIFTVNENVLIPRPETEELVRWVISELTDINKKQRLLDIGTGSGCIAISLAKALPEVNVSSLDKSDKALKVAAENAINNKVKVNFFEADILALQKLDVRVDCIVSNPPYVRQLEKKEMAMNVLENEPAAALFVPNNDPLLFYKAIVRFANENLTHGGTLFLEINQYFGKETMQLLEMYNFSEIELRKDMYGNDRMLKGRLSIKV